MVVVLRFALFHLLNVALAIFSYFICTISEVNMATQVSKKRKFVADGVFKAELNEFLTRELAEDGYSGVEVN